jgi:transglutaminase-like putative cysteine protease
MIRIRLCVLVCLVAAAPAAAQDKKPEAISLKQAIEELDKKIADLQEEVGAGVGKLVKADTDAEKAEAERAFIDRHRVMLEAEISRQRLLNLPGATGKGPAAKKTLDGWLEHTQKSTPKLPQPSAPPAVSPDFTKVDKYALATPAAETKSIARLAKYLTKGLNDDTDKARSIYAWMIENIAYDINGQLQKKAETRPDLVLETRCTTCAGYSQLYAALANSAGLPTSIVNGRARALQDPTRDPRTLKTQNGILWGPHGWNAVKLDGKAYLVDPTWGAALMLEGGKKDPKKEVDFDYFLVPAEAFVYTHAPDDPRWQLLKTPLTKKEQEALPILLPGYFRFGLQIGNAAQPALTVRDSLLVTLEAPVDTVIKARTFPLGNLADSKDALVQVRGRTVEIRAAFPGAGAYGLQIGAGKKGEASKESTLAMTYRVDAKGGNCYLPAVYAKSRDAAYLYHPLTERVPAGKPQAFVVSVPNAAKVVVVSGGKNLPLQKRGDLFASELSLKAGDILVAAFFPDNLKNGPALYKFVAE